MIKNKKHINPSDYIKKYRRGGLVPLFQGGGDMDPLYNDYDPMDPFSPRNMKMIEMILQHDPNFVIPFDPGTNNHIPPDVLDKLKNKFDQTEPHGPRVLPVDTVPSKLQYGSEMDPGMYDPNANIYIPDWQMDENVQLYDENADVDNSNENITDDGIILDEGELQCQMCDGGFPINVAPVNGACPEGSIPDDGKTNPCDAEKTEDTEEQTEGSQDTQITKTERGAPGWHTPDPYDIGPYGEPGDLFHLMGTIHGMGTDLGLWNPGFRGDDTTTTTTVPGQEGQEEEIQGEDVVCQACDNGYPINVASVDGKCPPGSSPDDGTNPCDKSENTDSETDTNKEKDTDEEISFDEAFAAARTAGKETFEWNGKTYNTKTREEADAEKDQKTLDALKEGIKPPQSQSEIDIQNERDRILSGDDQWWNTGANVPDTDGDGIPDTVDSANEYIWSQMYGGSTPYFQGGGTIDESEYEQDQRQKDAANIADTLDLQGPNTNYLASMNANPNATDQPFIGPKLPNLDPDGDGINTGIDATPEGTDPNFIGPQPQPTPDLDPDNDNLNIGVDATPFGDDGPNFNPQDNESDDEGGDIACQKCEDGYPMNVAPVDGQCPEGSTPDDGSDPCAGQPAPKDEETEETTEEETTEETEEEEGEKQPFKPFRAAIKAAEFVNAWSRKRADRKKKRQAMLETSSDYVFGDSATDATNKGQYDVNTGRMQPDKQVYARQGKYGIELPIAQEGGSYWDNLYNNVTSKVDQAKGWVGDQVTENVINPVKDEFNRAVDVKGFMAGEQGMIPDFYGQSTYDLTEDVKKGLDEYAANDPTSVGKLASALSGQIGNVQGAYNLTQAENLDDVKNVYNELWDNNLKSTKKIFSNPVASIAKKTGLDEPIADAFNTGKDYVANAIQPTIDKYYSKDQPTVAIASDKVVDKEPSAPTGRYGKELYKASMGLEWLKNNYPGFNDLTPDQQKQVLNQYSSNSQSQNTSGFSQQYLDTQKYKDEQRTLGYDPVINDLPSWLRKTREGYGRVIIDDEMERRMRGQLAGGKLDPQVAKEYARFLSTYRGPAAIDYNIDKYNRFQGYDADKQSRFNYPGVAFGYKDDLPGKGAWDTVSGDYSPNTLAAWIQLADQVNQPKKYKDLDEESIIAKDKKEFNKMLYKDFKNIEDDFLDDDYDMSLAYIPEDIEEEEDPFGPEGFANVDQDLMNRLNRPNDEIVSLPTKTIDQIPTASIDQLPTRSTSVQKNTKSAYDFSGKNPYEYGTDEYYNWKKAKRTAMFADEEPKKKPTKKENKRAEMFADAYVPQSQRAYGGEELDLDAKTIRKLIALGADIEIL